MEIYARIDRFRAIASTADCGAWPRSPNAQARRGMGRRRAAVPLACAFCRRECSPPPRRGSHKSAKATPWDCADQPRSRLKAQQGDACMTPFQAFATWPDPDSRGVARGFAASDSAVGFFESAKSPISGRVDPDRNVLSQCGSVDVGPATCLTFLVQVGERVIYHANLIDLEAPAETEQAATPGRSARAASISRVCLCSARRGEAAASHRPAP